jgi:adenylate kinase family enzyme
MSHPQQPWEFTHALGASPRWLTLEIGNQMIANLVHASNEPTGLPRYRDPVANVLVTGMSGTGKTACLEVLRSRGYHVVDTDTDEWSIWSKDSDGSPDWIWNEDAISSLLDRYEHDHLFVAGCKTNQGKFYSRFDHVVLLSAPLDIILERVIRRSTNPYGKSDSERQQIVRYLWDVEPRLRATATMEIDATAPLLDVVAQLERLALSDPM